MSTLDPPSYDSLGYSETGLNSKHNPYHFQWRDESQKKFTEAFSPYDTVRDVKEKLAQKAPGLQWTDMRITILGDDAALSDKATLADCHIPPYAPLIISATTSLPLPTTNNPTTKPTTTTPAPGDFQVFIKTINGRTIAVSLGEDSTVEKLKEAMQEKEGVEVSQQRLIFGGKDLSDNKKLVREYNVQKLCTLWLVERAKGGCAE